MHCRHPWKCRYHSASRAGLRSGLRYAAARISAPTLQGLLINTCLSDKDVLLRKDVLQDSVYLLKRLLKDSILLLNVNEYLSATSANRARGKVLLLLQNSLHAICQRSANSR